MPVAAADPAGCHPDEHLTFPGWFQLHLFHDEGGSWLQQQCSFHLSSSCALLVNRSRAFQVSLAWIVLPWTRRTWFRSCPAAPRGPCRMGETSHLEAFAE